MSSTTLAEIVAEARPGFASGKSDDDGYVQVRMNNVSTDGKLSFQSVRRVPRADANLARFAVEPGDILFNATNSPELVGKSALFVGHDEPVVYSNHFLRLRLICNQANPGYVSHWLQAKRSEGVFTAMCKQWVNQATVEAKRLMAMQLPLPPLPEQRRIAAILDQADALRAKRRAALVQLDATAQAIFVEMFGDLRTNPLGWNAEQVLGDVASIASGITKGRKLPTAPLRRVPYLAVTNVQDRALRLQGIKHIDASEDEITRYSLKPGDLVLTEGGDPDKLGRGVLWRDCRDFRVWPGGLPRFRPWPV